MVNQFVPDAGDIVCIDFESQSAQELVEPRYALVLSPFEYNSKTGLCILCLITGQIKGYPFEVSGVTLDGCGAVVLADHIKSVDWQTHNLRSLGKATCEVIGTVQDLVAAIIGVNFKSKDAS